MGKKGVEQAFTDLRKANTNVHTNSQSVGKLEANLASRQAARSRALELFGGDSEKMMGAFKRWGKTLGRGVQSVDFILPKQTIDDTMQGMEDRAERPVREAAKQARLKVTRKSRYGSA